MSYPFPDDVRNPDRKEPNPFADSEPQRTDTDVAGDTFGAQANAADYNPVYETTYEDRVVSTLIAAVVGFAASLLGWLYFSGYTNTLLFPYISLVFSGAATILGGSDLRGMRAGAIKASRSRLSALGQLLGMLGLFSSFAHLAYGFFYDGWFR